MSFLVISTLCCMLAANHFLLFMLDQSFSLKNLKQDAYDAGAAPQVVLAATHAVTLQVVSLADLRAHAVDPG